jgi:hypothetical protein
MYIWFCRMTLGSVYDYWENGLEGSENFLINFSIILRFNCLGYGKRMLAALPGTVIGNEERLK